MQVVVEFISGTIFHILIGNDATVLDLKIAIQNQVENFPADRLILFRDIKPGEHIMLDEDEKSLTEYGVQDGSHLLGFFKAPPGETDDDDDDDDDDDADADADTGDDKVLDKDRTESDSEEEVKNYNAGNTSGSSTPKTPYEEDSVQSPEYVSVSDSD